MKTKIACLLICFFLTLENAFSQEDVECSESYLTSDWSLVGPFQDNLYSNIGRVISIWVSPDDPDYILIGTRASGVWKTINGGENWENLTGHQLPACGATGIAVYDNGTTTLSDDHIYITTVFLGTEINEYNVGVAFSEDNGTTWEYDYSMDSDPSLGTYPFTRTGNIGSPNVYLKPGTDNLYILNGSIVYIKDLSSGDWSIFKNIDDFSTGTNHYPIEVDFLQGYADFTVISVADGTTSDVYYTYNGGADWEPIPAPTVPTPPTGYTLSNFKFSTTITNPEAMYILYTFGFENGTSDLTISYLYRYTVPLGGTIAITETHDVSGLTSGYIGDNVYESRELFVCPDATDICFIRRGQGELFKTDLPTNSDPITFYPASQYYGSKTHADIRDMEYYQSGSLSYVYIAHDGGVSRCDDKESISSTAADDNDGLWENLNGLGLAITEFNGFSNSELEDNRIFAGSGDGNSFVVKKSVTDPSELDFINYPSLQDYARAEISTINADVAVTNSNGGFFRDDTQTKKYNLGTLNYVNTLDLPLPTAATGMTISNSEETNWGYRPFDFDETGIFWMASVDMFSFEKEATSDFPANTSNQITSSFYKDADLSDYTTYEPITAYKRIMDYPLELQITIYYSTKEVQTTGDPNKLIKALYVPTDPNPYSNIDITPNTVIGDAASQISSSWITDIETDPQNPLQVWISFGATKGSFTHNYLTTSSQGKSGKVYFSPDGGTTWYNRSDGLPNYPILCLTYWKGSNDILFAGTDVGVFAWHPDLESETGEGTWECFNENLPYCSVNDLEINNCSQTLRASTFGFGIWETPLPVSVIEDYDEIEISSDVIWTQSIDILSDIVVNSGATLTIQNCEVRMPPSGKIIVENGASLILDGGTITNHCELWEGIEVWGKGGSVAHPTAVGDIYTGSYPVDGDDHGVVLIKNGGTIENSLSGIVTYNSADPSNSGYYGGIIVANEANFHNNATSIDFRPFDSGASNTDDDNISEFRYCSFVKDEELPCGTICPADVFLTDVDGVYFDKCTFANSFVNCSDFNYPVGIKSVNATYTVHSELCIPPAEVGCEVEISSFTGYYRAIWAANTAYRPLKIRVEGVDFIDNERAMLFSAVSNSEIWRNNFEIPDYDSKTGYGLYLEGCINYHVEGNYFTSYGSMTNSSHYCSGIFVENNHNTATEIYRNSFDNIEIGIRSQGNNSKLQIRCNDFNTPILDYNIIVTSGTLGNQGICNATITQPAGNQFSHDDFTESDFRIVPSGVNLNYRHHTEATYIPEDYTTTQINLHNCSVSGAEDCVSTLPGGTGGEERMMMTKATEYQAAIELELAKIDGGNTGGMITDIQGGASQTEVKYALDEASPYISNEVLVALVNEEPLGTTEMLDVMHSNYPISDTVATSLEISNYDVPSAVIETLSEDIVDNMLTVSAMSDLLATVSVLETKREYAVLQSINHLVDEIEIDSAIALVSEETGDWARQQEVQILTSISNYSQAESALEQYSSVDQFGEDFKTLYTIINDIESTERTLAEITNSEESTLRNMASKETHAGIASLNVLSYLYKEESYPEVIDEIPQIEYRQIDEVIKQSNADFRIYPNPADELVFIELTGKTDCENFLYVYDITGVRVLATALRNDYKLTWIDTEGFQTGIYFFEVFSNGNTFGAEKVIIE